jgi:hypothetical protein
LTSDKDLGSKYNLGTKNINVDTNRAIALF